MGECLNKIFPVVLSIYTHHCNTEKIWEQLYECLSIYYLSEFEVCDVIMTSLTINSGGEISNTVVQSFSIFAISLCCMHLQLYQMYFCMVPALYIIFQNMYYSMCRTCVCVRYVFHNSHADICTRPAKQQLLYKQQVYWSTYTVPQVFRPCWPVLHNLDSVPSVDRTTRQVYTA